MIGAQRFKMSGGSSFKAFFSTIEQCFDAISVWPSYIAYLISSPILSLTRFLLMFCFNCSLYAYYIIIFENDRLVCLFASCLDSAVCHGLWSMLCTLSQSLLNIFAYTVTSALFIFQYACLSLMFIINMFPCFYWGVRFLCFRAMSWLLSLFYKALMSAVVVTLSCSTLWCQVVLNYSPYVCRVWSWRFTV